MFINKGADFCDQNDVLRNLGMPAKGVSEHVKKKQR